MPFKVQIHLPDICALGGSEMIEPCSDLDDLALPLCELLDEVGVVFTAGGFGDDRWPVDVRYDLASIMPQLPEIIDSLISGVEVELDFFEQGIQRTVTVSYAGDRAILACRSYGKWKPVNPIERVERGDFEAMMVEMARKLARAVSLVAPALSEMDPFPKWRML